jgi:hypothetical protein
VPEAIIAKGFLLENLVFEEDLMSQAGFAMLFLLCSPEGCQEVALRATRYADTASCHAVLPEALSQARRHFATEHHVIAVCRSLDEACRQRIAPLASQSSGYVLRISGPAQSRGPIGVDAVLSILCAEPPTDCSG